MNENKIDFDLAEELIENIREDEMGEWFELPEKMAGEELAKIYDLAEEVNEKAEILVCVGIGGSYLGTRAVYEALGGEYGFLEGFGSSSEGGLKSETRAGVKLLFAGNSISSFELRKVLADLEGKDFCVNIISKSGTTLEPSLAFRVLKKELEKRYGAKEAKERIFATTDGEKGALREEVVKNGYRSLEIPRGAGGRYSVLSAVGLFPLAAAGVDVGQLLAGARECKETQLGFSGEDSATKDTEGRADSKILRKSMLVSYAFSRYYLSQEYGCDTEVLATFEPRMAFFLEWWKQLFGESEGKGGQGIFPAAVVYSTDLHSLGQFMQEGRRNMFETFLRFSPDAASLRVPALGEALDGLEYLAGRTLNEVNEKALEATVKAHDMGGISTFVIEVLDDAAKNGISEKVLGFLIFFFEVACAMSAMLHGVDPFDQPGVEKYKKEMVKLLKK